MAALKNLLTRGIQDGMLRMGFDILKSKQMIMKTCLKDSNRGRGDNRFGERVPKVNCSRVKGVLIG